MRSAVFRLSSAVLCCLLVFPSVACSKKKSDQTVRTVQESDPYYKAETFDLSLPEAEEDLVLESALTGRIEALSSAVVAEYEVQYVMPSELADKYQRYATNPMLFSSEEEAELMDEVSRYERSGMLVYNLDGSIRCDIPSGKTGEPAPSRVLEGPDGRILVLMQDFGEAPDWHLTYYIAEITESGELSKLYDLDCEDEMFHEVMIMDNGNLLCSGWSGVSEYNTKGECVGADQPTDGEIIQEMFCQNGKYYVLFWVPDADEGSSIYYFRAFDPATAKLGAAHIDAEDSSLIQGNDGVYFIYGNDVEKIDIEGRKTEKVLLSWNDVDVNRNGIVSFYIKSDEDMYFVRRTRSQDDIYFDSVGKEEASIVRLTKEAKNPHAGKKIITVASPTNAAMLPNALIDRIVDYNSDQNKDIRIELVDYSTLSTPFPPMDQSEEAVISQTVDKVYLDLLSGSGPDILVNFGQYSQFDNEKVLMDLNPLIDGENGLNRAEYFDNIFRACEKDGHLYQIPVNVLVSGLVADKRYTHDKTSWSYDDFLSVMGSLPEDVTMISEKNWADLLEMFLYSEGRTFIDYENRAVRFDDPKFLQILQIVKSLGSSRSEEDIMKDTPEDYYGGINPDLDYLKEGMTACASVKLYHILDFAQFHEVNGGDVTFIGYPGNDKGGFSAEYNLSIGIAKASSFQKEAWDFVRFLFDQETQEMCADAIDGYPVHKGACRNVLGNQVALYEEAMENPGVGYTRELMMSYPKLAESTIDQNIALLENIHAVRSFDKTVLLLIKEEAEGYILGNRSAEDVAKNIQNRSATVINER